MSAESTEHPQILVLGPDGTAVAGEVPEASGERPVTEMVEQPAKVMRIGSMIRQLLEEVRRPAGREEPGAAERDSPELHQRA